MEAFTTLNGLVAPMDRPNVDTDAIIPKQFLKSISRTGFGPYLFDEWRYQDHGEPGQDCSDRPLREDFVLNQPSYRGAEILLARENFGCGSSREHAVWALREYGFRCLIAPSFADIFFSNCGKNGVLAIPQTEAVIEHLFAQVSANADADKGYRLSVDLQAQTITEPDGNVIPFEIDPALRQNLLNGLDDIALTLRNSDEIKAYEKQRARQAPWLFT